MFDCKPAPLDELFGDLKPKKSPGPLYIIGRLCVERKTLEEGEKEGDIEILDKIGLSNVSAYDMENEDLETLVYDPSDVPQEPGLYILLYAARITSYRDYWGEYDVDADVEWKRVTAVTDEKEVAGLMDSLL